ncbi:MAG: DUF1049 domain-containing protein [Proteobacteria bacterium]|nr:DUF1049 domain-containing protein [Pseudomonadota bacterium]MBU4470751.1 DUF1049 domain-containing protein [Pseudomonadota bacterium]MCG2751521.1 lipopolysaccharide assembly protein LapA domain-containing protein [Desulfobacteraceae bacterium]
MSKLKIVFWSLIAGFFGLVIAQNQSYFMARQTLDVNLYFGRYSIPELPNLLFLLVFFLIGFLMAYFFGLYDKFKHNKALKNLNQQLTSRAETIARLETENDSLKSAMEETHSKKQIRETAVQEEKNMTEPDQEPEA